MSIEAMKRWREALWQASITINSVSVQNSALASLRELDQAIEQAEQPQPVAWAEFVETACALIKAADDAAADRDYMLDSDDCISVLRGTWTAPMANDHPPAPPRQPVAWRDAAKAAGFSVARGAGLLPSVPEDAFIGNICVTRELQKFAELMTPPQRQSVDNESDNG